MSRFFWLLLYTCHRELLLCDVLQGKFKWLVPKFMVEVETTYLTLGAYGRIMVVILCLCVCVCQLPHKLLQSLLIQGAIKLLMVDTHYAHLLKTRCSEVMAIFANDQTKQTAMVSFQTVFSPAYISPEVFSTDFSLMSEWEECNSFDVSSGSIQISPSHHALQFVWGEHCQKYRSNDNST